MAVYSSSSGAFNTSPPSNAMDSGTPVTPVMVGESALCGRGSLFGCLPGRERVGRPGAE